MNNWLYTKIFFLSGGRILTQEERQHVKIEAGTESQGDTGSGKKLVISWGYIKLRWEMWTKTKEYNRTLKDIQKSRRGFLWLKR